MPATFLVFFVVARYLFYRKVAATLVVRTDRAHYQPGDDIMVRVSIDTDQTLLISSGTARLNLARPIGEGGYDNQLLSERFLRLLQDKELLHGDSYEWTATLSLPTDILSHMGKEDFVRLDVALETSPRADAKIELVVATNS